MSRGKQLGSPGSWKQKFPLIVLNATAEIIPPFAVMQLGAGTAVGTDVAYNVVKPTGTSSAKYVLNSPASIPVSVAPGAATDFYPADALITGTPGFNQEIGPVAGSWALSVSGKGFIYLGGLVGGVGRVAAKSGTTAGDDFPLVKIVNVSGTTKLAGSIVGYGPPVDPPPGAFNRVPTFQSAPPTQGQPFCVLLSDVAPGGTCDAGPVGIVPTQINLTDATHGYGEAITGDYAKLQSGASGQAKIIHREKEAIIGSATLGQQWAQVRLDPLIQQQQATSDDIRGYSWQPIPAATGTQGGPITPGVAQAKIYIQPTGPAGTPWQIQSNPVTVENWMFAAVAINKPIILKKSRLDQNGLQIYLVHAEGCAAIPSG